MNPKQGQQKKRSNGDQASSAAPIASPSVQSGMIPAGSFVAAAISYPLPSATTKDPDHGYLIHSGSPFLSYSPEQQHRMLADLETYRRELPRLLQEDEVGRFALVREGSVVSVWDTAGDALQASRLLYGEAEAAVYLVKANDLVRFGMSQKDEKPASCQP